MVGDLKIKTTHEDILENFDHKGRSYLSGRNACGYYRSALLTYLPGLGNLQSL